MSTQQITDNPESLSEPVDEETNPIEPTESIENEEQVEAAKQDVQQEVEEAEEAEDEPTGSKRAPLMTIDVSSVKKGPTEKKKARSGGIFNKSLLVRRIPLMLQYVGNSIKDNLEKKISADLEGKCTTEGYIKPDSVSVLTFSSGEIKGNNIMFETSFECLVCNPVEGMLINCTAKNITKAGIRAELEMDPSPLVIFVARDHHFSDTVFAQINEGDSIKVRVIGQRYELNDKNISVIASLVEQTSDRSPEKKKQPRKRITIKNDD